MLPEDLDSVKFKTSSTSEVVLLMIGGLVPFIDELSKMLTNPSEKTGKKTFFS